MALIDALRSQRVSTLPRNLALENALERWRESLTTCLPAGIGRALVPRDQRLTLIPHGDKALICRGKGEERQTLGEIDSSSFDDILRTLLAGAKAGPRQTLLELPADQVMSRTVSFPDQVRKNLHQVVAYEIDRLTPFHADQVCFDYRLLEAQSKGGKLAVQIALCRRDQVSDWVERLRQAGAPVEEILWAGAWPKANMLPAGDRPQRIGRGFSATRISLFLVLCLAAAALIGPVWQKTRILENLESNLSDLEAKAEEVYELRAAIDRARQGSVAVLERKSEQPRMIDLLSELTDRLGDDTWVQNLDYRGGEVQIRGESTQAAALIGLLEQAPGFEEVGFRSPVVQVASTGQERFHIAFRYTRADETP
jgi:general secretion pathway protein L